MGQLRIHLLGSFEVSIDARPITKFDSAKVRAFLAYLAVEYHESHTREKLVRLFWPNMPEKRARNNLSQALYNQAVKQTGQPRLLTFLPPKNSPG